ncbi:MAG: HDOD domain-containing protein [Campylobacterota bacterium]|nr:HDOD domain-containing protein [Campylobacterota bacterium]
MSILGRQSVSNDKYEIFAYDILYRSDSTEIYPTNLSTSASSLAAVLNDFGFENIIGNYKGFIRVDTEFLSQEIIYTIDPKQFVLMILQTSLLDEELPAKLNELTLKGYSFGLNDIIVNQETVRAIVSLIDYVDYIKIDVTESDSDLVDKLIKILKLKRKTIIAAKVETDEEYQEYKDKGVDYFQGYYIKRPKIIQSTSFNASQEQVLQILNLLQNDAETKEIVEALEHNHALTLKLMQFINSSFFSFRTQVSSISQIINLLGRSALSNWLLLFMATGQNKNKQTNHPLLLMVINRTEIMTGLLRLVKPDASQSDKDTAYLVGMLSLIHLLFEIEHREFLHKLRVTDEIEEAMFEATGFFGQLLVLTRFIENAETQHLYEYIEKYNVNMDDLNNLVTQAMIRVNTFDEMIKESF